MASQEAMELLESVLNESKGNAYTRAYEVQKKKAEDAHGKIKAAYREKFKERQDALAQAHQYEVNGDKEKAKELRMKAIKINKDLKKIEDANSDFAETLLVDDLRAENLKGWKKEVGKKYVDSKSNKPANARINAQINRNQANPGSFAKVKLEAAEILVEALSAIFED